MSTTASHWAESLRALAEQGLHRSLRTVEAPQAREIRIDGHPLLCLASNNYLGLASDPRVLAAVQAAVQQWGWGAAASPLVCGHMAPHQQLEVKLAAFKRTQAALLCTSGYQANLAAVRTLAGRGDIVFLDKLDHASIIDAARGSGAVLRVFPHRDYRKLERLLDRSASARRRVIVTDSLFSMDGDFADLPRLVELKRRYDAILCIDEAHATGVCGPGGRGVAEMMEVESDIDVVVGTLSKALGGVGGFIAGSAAFIEMVVNTAGAYIYSTALPPAACAAASVALDIVASPEGRQRREALATLSACLRDQLAARGLDTAGSASQIVPVVLGSADEALRVARALEQDGLFVPAIRPPTVPRGRARLRISLSSEHRQDDLDRLLASLDRLPTSPDRHLRK